MADTLRADLAEDAFREGNIVSVGTAPTAAEQAESATLLDRLIVSLIGQEIGEKLQNISQPVPDRSTWNHPNWYPDPARPPLNYRVLVDQTDDFTITFDPKPGDGARMAVAAVQGPVDVTIDANGHYLDTGDRTVLQQSTTLTLAQGIYYEWFYRADLAQWILIKSNDAGPFPTLDESPFPLEFDSLLITYTTVRLQPRYGQEVLIGTRDELLRMMKIARARYKQNVQKITNPDVPLVPGPTEFYGGYRG